MRNPNDVLRQTFGYPEFRPGQEDVIQAVLNRRDTLVIMPTGGGKSMCYQVPALCLSGTTLVVSPLIALMKDQVDALVATGVQAAYYNSSLGEREARSTLAALRNGELDLLYVSPERLQHPGFLEHLRAVQLSFLAVDEAHCVSSWGHDFRPDYARLGEWRAELGDLPVLALTATADTATRTDILQQLRLTDPAVFVTGFDRPNITYHVMEKQDPAAQLAEIVERHPEESGIVYALSRKRVEQVAERLQKQGIEAAAYHAGLSDSVRQSVHEGFVHDRIHVVVATVAFGMGIDKPDIRYVVHYDIPKNIEGYYQETGRAGRDGLPSEAVLLLGYQDVITARSLVEQGSDPEQRRIELSKLNAMVAFCEATSCRRQVLLRYFGDDSGKPCGNCDRCLSPPETFDGTEEAQKILSCIYRVGQRFGAGHVIDVLRGNSTARAERLGHTGLSTWGIGADRSAHEWGSLIRQLIHFGYIQQDLANYAVLKLTGESRPVLQGIERVELVKPPPPRSRKKKGKSKRAAPAPSDLNPKDQELFTLLRSIRLQLSKQESIPPYMVFGDKTLRELAVHKPRSPQDMLALHGVGQSKLEKYGSLFLETVATFGESGKTE